MLRSYTAPLFVQAEISLKMFEVSPLIGFGSVKGWGLKISWWMLKWFNSFHLKLRPINLHSWMLEDHLIDVTCTHMPIDVTCTHML